MYKILIKGKELLCIISLISLNSFSQNPVIENINLNVNNDNIIINYKLKGVLNYKHNIDFILMDKNKNIYIPQNIKDNIENNLNKNENMLIFNMLNQSFPLDQELTPRLILDHNYKNGPNSAFLSIIVPGLGDYLVEDSRNMIIKPYYRTAGTLGFLALAYIANSKRETAKYYEADIWVDGKYINAKWIPSHYTTESFQTAPKDQWLFKNDKEVFLGIAAGIWFFDIFWVLSKGQENQKIKKAINNKRYKLCFSNNGFLYRLNLN